MLDAYVFRIVVASCTDSLIIMQCPSFPLVIVCSLVYFNNLFKQFISSDMTIETPAFFDFHLHGPFLLLLFIPFLSVCMCHQILMHLFRQHVYVSYKKTSIQLVYVFQLEHLIHLLFRKLTMYIFLLMFSFIKFTYKHFTVLYQSLLYNEVNQLHVCIYLLPLIPPADTYNSTYLAHHTALS